MNLLILGGTRFLGRALVESALRSGHRVTLFNRGKSAPGLFEGVEELLGDRDGGLDALGDGRWDAVIDTCGYVPRVVRQSAQALAGRVERYVFVSSLSVYADTRHPGVDESAAVGWLADESVEEITGETYGPLKALCEQAVEAALPGRALVVRPGLIVGPYDPTDRFTYWPARVAQGGEVLAPGRAERFVQFIDVRDLADWMIRLTEARAVGTFNADGPAGGVTMGALLEACRRASAADAHFTWLPDEFLLAQQVGAWMEMPLWLPESDPDAGGFFAFSIDKAVHAGLTFRPLEETVRATLEWLAGRAADAPWKAGLSREREHELLRRWHAAQETKPE